MHSPNQRLTVSQIEVGSMQNFVYLLANPSTKEAIAIDSGWEIQPITKLVLSEGLRLKYAIVTHGHFDHTETINELAGKLGTQVAAHELSGVKCDRKLRDGETIMLGEVAVRVMHTPGHTEDSICLYDGSNLVTGDTLFIGSWGRTDLPGGSAAKLFHSIHDRIMKLPGETIIYPGHDYGNFRSRKLADEARENPALLAKSAEEFIEINS